MAKASKKVEIVEVQEIEMAEIKFCVIGKSPLIMNRFQQKAWQELLFPSERRSRAEREQTLKHDPIAEYRGAVYRNRDPKAPTLIHIPNGAFHGALAQVAVDVPGAAKAKIERLTKVVNVNINLFGVPSMFMAMVRNSDMNHTPDVRTRPIFEQWACEVTISYVRKILTERTIVNLFSAAGVIVGIGDWRGQKGGPFGAFRTCKDHDADFRQIVKTQGRKAQEAALLKPTFFDTDTEELFTWFERELELREKDDLIADAQPRTKRTYVENGKGELQGDAE